MVHESYARIGFQSHQIVAAAAAVVTDVAGVAGPVVDAEYDVAADVVAVAVAAGGDDEKDLQGP